MFRLSSDHPQGAHIHFLSRLNKTHVSRHKYQIKDCTLRGNCRSLISATLHKYLLRYSLYTCLLIHSFNVCTENLWNVFTELLGIRIYYDGTCVFTDTLCMYLLIHCVFTETHCMHILTHCVFTETLCTVFTETLCMYILRHCVFTETLCMLILRHCIYWDTVHVYTDTLYIY
jgi:hypothetical protein